MFEMIKHFYIGFHSGERLELIKPARQVKMKAVMIKYLKRIMAISDFAKSKSQS